MRYFAQCDHANPNGPDHGTAFYGGPKSSPFGNCNHRKYVPRLIELVRTGAIRPEAVLTQSSSLTSALEAYKNFDKRETGWIKVKLEPEAEERAA